MFQRPMLLLSCALMTCVPVARAADRAPGRGPTVTVYSGDLAFVRESRTLELESARDTVRLVNVPERLDFPSVRLTLAGGARVTRLAYRYDVASGDGLLDRARGSRVRVTMRDDRVVEGALLATDGAWMVVRTDEGALSTLARTAVEDVRLASPPAGVTLRPTLEAVVEGAKRGRVEAELSYLTGGLSWSAEHALVRSGESGASWSTTVTVQNGSGRDFLDARIKLVAGEPHRDVPMPVPMARGRALEMTAVAEKADLSEETFGEYHLYTLDRPATLFDRESQSLTMLEPRSVRVAPRYLYRGGMPGVTAQLELHNTSAAGLGIPLAAGRVRVYEHDAGGEAQFTGETRIRHTAEGEKVTLDVGTVFDIAAERREVYNRRISDREREYQIEVKLRNRKQSDVSVMVEEGVGGDHEVVKKTHEFVRKDASTLQFTIAVPAGKEAVLSYAVRVRY